MKKVQSLFGAEKQSDEDGVPDGWLMNRHEATASARSLGKKFVLVKIHANWCGYCKQFDVDVAGDNDLSAYLSSKFACAWVNEKSKEGKSLRKEQKIVGYPCFLVYGANGEFIEKIRGYQSPDALLSSLREAVYLK